MTKRKRSFRETHKKIVAAAQQWKCSSCKELLKSTYEVDHVVPLWEGGADSMENATALCCECHRTKTQLEAIRRADASRAAKEQKVRSEEEGRRDDLVLKEGRLRCNLCGLSRFAIFEHKKCPAVERNIQERLAPKRKADAVAETQNVVHFFDQFLFTAKL